MREAAGEIGIFARRQTEAEIIKAKQREEQRTRDRQQIFMPGTTPATPQVPKTPEVTEALSGILQPRLDRKTWENLEKIDVTEGTCAFILPQNTDAQN